MLKFTGVSQAVRNAHLAYSRTVKSHGLESEEAAIAKREVNRQKALHILDSVIDDGIQYLTEDERASFAARIQESNHEAMH